MDVVNNILRVPADEYTRVLIRTEAAGIVRETGLRPPAGMETLRQYAMKLIEKAGISDDYTNFAMVLIGNETWKSTMLSIPFNRRLLLLPQCLRHINLCEGRFDNLGLICSGCNNCILDSILDDAEELGYTTLITEGTTVTLKLIEESSIDAIIGVSCMPVLQKSFEPVTRAAIPVIGLPLMNDGCKNTSLDYKWLSQEIRYGPADGSVKNFSIYDLNTTVSGFFTSQKISTMIDGTGIVESHAKEILLQGGKRMRPLMAALAYSAYSPQVDSGTMEKLALIIEYFHKASLIHDDIEDDSDYRYGVETLHKKYGIPMAINTGDYLVGKGYNILPELPSDNDARLRCLQLISSSHINITIGQGLDLCLDPLLKDLNMEQLLNIFRLKTSQAVRTALLSGAITGGADEDEIRILEDFSDSFGIAFQINDDLEEFRERVKHGKISEFPFLIALINEQRKKKNGSDQTVSENHTDPNLIIEEMERNRIPDLASEILNKYINNCYKVLDSLRNPVMRLGLYRIMGKIFRSYGSAN